MEMNEGENTARQDVRASGSSERAPRGGAASPVASAAAQGAREVRHQ